MSKKKNNNPEQIAKNAKAEELLKIGQLALSAKTREALQEEADAIISDCKPAQVSEGPIGRDYETGRFVVCLSVIP